MESTQNTAVELFTLILINTTDAIRLLQESKLYWLVSPAALVPTYHLACLIHADLAV